MIRCGFLEDSTNPCVGFLCPHFQWGGGDWENGTDPTSVGLFHPAAASRQPSPGAVAQNPPCVRESDTRARGAGDGGGGAASSLRADERRRRQRGKKRERERELGKVAGFALEPRLCQTCATAAAAAATPRCVSALAERRAHQPGEGGEGREAEASSGATETRSSESDRLPQDRAVPAAPPSSPARQRDARHSLPAMETAPREKR